mmetsp:Transcript_80957/g.210281  ORF Transcript_80957/g.210281 Transcript_80957/m.210281 type:complete len:112 (-) Transcript_80957:1620-1955(-)
MSQELKMHRRLLHLSLQRDMRSLQSEEAPAMTLAQMREASAASAAVLDGIPMPAPPVACCGFPNWSSSSAVGTPTVLGLVGPSSSTVFVGRPVTTGIWPSRACNVTTFRRL